VQLLCVPDPLQVLLEGPPLHSLDDVPLQVFLVCASVH